MQDEISINLFFNQLSLLKGCFNKFSIFIIFINLFNEFKQKLFRKNFKKKIKKK